MMVRKACFISKSSKHFSDTDLSLRVRKRAGISTVIFAAVEREAW
jgi:hypothetical protein